jgi:hypothetical protein
MELVSLLEIGLGCPNAGTLGSNLVQAQTGPVYVFINECMQESL